MDEQFGLRIGALTQFRYLAEVEGSSVRHGFRFRVVRPTLLAHGWGDRLELLIVPEFAGSPELLDAVATVRILPELQFQIGQYRTWYTRHFQITLPLLILPDRGPVNDEFNVGRDRGVTVLGRLWDDKFEYAAGVLNGEGIDDFNINPHMLYTGRIVVNPLGPMPYDSTLALADERPLRVSFGLNAYTNEVEQFEPDPQDPEALIQVPDLRTWGAGGDFALAWERLHVLGEGFWRLSEMQGRSDEHDWGVALEAAVMVVERRLELAYRNSVLDVADVTTVPVEPGLNVYISGNTAKLQIRYQCNVDPSDGDCTFHQGVVQGQVFF